MRRKRFWIMAPVLALVLALVLAQPTYADDITVDTTNDVLDAASGICNDVTIDFLPGPDGVISLREAICAANNNSGPDTILFNITGCSGVCTIQPTIALPVLTDNGTTIDGYSQPGTAEATDGTPATLLIEISGASVSNNSGFNIISAGNVISGVVINRFGRSGVAIGFSTATDNIISGNHIGTDASGTADLGNTWDGVFIGLGAENNAVGGNTPAERNVISGNDWDGVAIHNLNTMSNTVSGNFIGTDAGGTADLGNSWDGVFIGLGAKNNTIGGNTPAERNVISGNDWDGVAIHNLNTMSNTVSGNFIGTNISGTAVLSNTWHGVYIYGGAKSNTVGGNTDGERNVISGNGRDGVRIYGSETMTNTVSGNFIGTNISSTAVLSNTWCGVRIEAGARDNTIGGDTEGERNVISGNGEDGVYIADSGTTGNTVSRNYIGLAANGTDDLGNSRDGVVIDDGAQNNTVGGDTEDERNVISGNGSGVIILDSDTMSNTISGNYIGTDANGTGDRGNGFGVRIWGAQNNTVGGDTDGERNIISGNDQHGVRIYSSDATGNTISGNYIGLAANGTDALGNDQNGVEIYGGPQNNTIGGNTDGERNVISGNGGHGVRIYGSDSTGNTISGNYIGLAANGTTDRGNSEYGVYIANGAQNNTVGGDTAGERNVISANDYDGVHISGSGTMSNTVSGNYIGLAANGTTDLGNANRGVYIVSDAQNNTVGPGNVIAYSGYEGVEVNGGSTTGNTITQNSIFSNEIGILLTAGANGDISAPVIVTTTEGSVNVVGTACAGCTVEVFENSDADGEGETYIGDTTATTSGAFTVTVSSLSDPYLTATATDATDGTSEFSAVFTATVPVGRDVYLPIILKSH